MQSLNYSAIIETPVGMLGIQCSENKLCNIDFLTEQTVKPFVSCEFSKIVIEQLHQYFLDPTFIFDLPIAIRVTPFQDRVLQAMRNISPGATLSYGTLAKKIVSSPRAVGNACRRNPIPIVIPCHRIVAQHDIGGFAGARQGKLIAIKKWLLQHETTTPACK